MATTRRPRAKSVAAEPFIDFLILADRAEVVGGKLYLMGGCFDQINATGLPFAYEASLAVRVMLPANDPRTDHTVEFTITGPGKPQLTTRGLRFMRQAAALPHAVQAMLAAPTIMTLEQAGEYAVTATVDGKGPKSYNFKVEDATATSP